MLYRRVLKSIAAIAVCGAIAQTLSAQAIETLSSGRSTPGTLNSTRSQLVPDGNAHRLANDYNFVGELGEQITIAIEAQGNLDLKLVVFNPLDEVVLSQSNDNLLKQGITYTLRSGGTYRIRVLAENNQGNYTIKIEAANRDAARADLVMGDLGYTPTICNGNPDLAVIQIGSETRCTRDAQAGEYLYNETDNKAYPVQETETLKDRIAREFGLQWVPCGGPGLAEISLEGETLCIGNYPAGEYRYNVATNRLDPVQPVDRNVALLREWGLTPTQCGNNVVSISIDGKQYCTLPTEWLTIGTYRYLPAQDRLEPLSQPYNPDYTNINTEPQPNNTGSGL